MAKTKTPKPAPVVRDATHMPLLRGKVREVLRMAPTRRFHEELLHQSVDALGMEATIEELREALLWNQSKGYVDYTHNGDFGRDEWFLTPRGKAKEGII
jgi:hypothetical protein